MVRPDPLRVIAKYRYAQEEEHRPGDVWQTDSGKWRAMNDAGNAQSFDSKEDATAHAKGAREESHGEDQGGGSLKGAIGSFLKKIKNLPATAVAAVKAAPPAVHKFVADKDHRKEVMTSVATGMKDGAKAIPGLIKNATKEELHEIKAGATAMKKFFKRPPEKLTGHDKKALYAVGAYVAAGAVGAVTGGAALAAGALGKSFLKHIAFKATSALLDKGFTHFEVGESLHHVVEHLHLASLERRWAGEEAPSDEESILIAHVYKAVQETFKAGLDDEAMKKIVLDAGAEDAA
jgi:hypothetical protein